MKIKAKLNHKPELRILYTNYKPKKGVPDGNLSTLIRP